MVSTVLPEYILNSLWLCGLVLVVGVGFLASQPLWLTTNAPTFQAANFEWALVLPLSPAPAYVMAYVYRFICSLLARYKPLL